MKHSEVNKALREPEEGAGKLLKEFGVSLAMVTLGPDGCLLKTKNASFRAACILWTPPAQETFSAAVLWQDCWNWKSRSLN